VKTSYKGRETPTFGCTCVHPSTPSGSRHFRWKHPKKGRETPASGPITSGQGRFWWRHFRSLSFRAASGDVTSGSSTTSNEVL
jgi:hypothetical protein